jgi:1-deoxy-D-xylulose-5-phosphate synthase
VLHDVCLQRLPVIFAIDRAGVVGEDGPTHHGVFDIAYLRSIPNLVVLAPKDENELRAMLYSASEVEGPVAIRYPRSRGQGVTLEAEPRFLPVGQAEVLRDPDEALYALFACGTTVAAANQASQRLAAQGIPTALINARSIKPLDEAVILEQVQRGRILVTIEDGVLSGGFGSAILECLAIHGLQGARVLRAGYPDAFVEHASIAELHARYGLDAEGLTMLVMNDRLRLLERAVPQRPERRVGLPLRLVDGAEDVLAKRAVGDDRSITDC